MVENPLLSIVVTSYTKERLPDIYILLDKIRHQTYSNIETVLIIEKSQELFKILKEYIDEKNIVRTKLVFNDGERGLSAARNLGLINTSGEFIAFIDDDAFPFSEWGNAIVNTFIDDSVIGVSGPSIPLWEDISLNWVPEEFYWIIGGAGYSEWTANREIRNVSGTNMAFRRSAFADNNRFSTNLGAIDGGGGLGKQKYGGEETDFCIRLRMKSDKYILYNPEVQVYHKVYKYRVTPKFIARRAYSEGYTKAMFNKRYRKFSDRCKLLDVEYQLLNRLFAKLLPNILRNLFIHPVVSFRQLGMTINVVFFVAAGYFSYSLRSVFVQ